MRPRTVRVLFVAGEGPANAGVHRRLKSTPSFQIVGRVANGDGTLTQINTHRPHAVIAHVSPTGKGLDTVQHITQGRPGVRVAVLSAHTDESVIRKLLRAGAVAILDTGACSREIEFAIRAVMHDGIYLSPMVCKAFVFSCAKCAHQQPISSRLTPRQREVLQLVAEGHTTKQIAKRLHLSAKTIETHRTQLMKQLGIHEVTGLVRYAVRVGLVSVDA